jgi:hypothetical protein
MKKQVYDLNDDGTIREIYVAEINKAGEIETVENAPDNLNNDALVTTDLPDGLGIAKWDGNQWISIGEIQPIVIEDEEFYQSQLNSTDYKIIKAMEYQMLGLNVGYNLTELHEQRQQLRDAINMIRNK